jgi:hypothetical protein
MKLSAIFARSLSSSALTAIEVCVDYFALLARVFGRRAHEVQCVLMFVI